jgi:alkylated DNA repair dioxygenase AlkB
MRSTNSCRNVIRHSKEPLLQIGIRSLSAEVSKDRSTTADPLATTLPAGARYIPDVIDAELQVKAWRGLMSDFDTFDTSEVLVDGQWHEAPRLVASFADVPVLMDGMKPSRPWPESLDQIRTVVAEVVGQVFNYGLANLYRDGQDFAGWHADKAALHHEGSLIAIVSLGAVRTLEFRGTDGESVAIDLAPGSVVVMDLPLQARWEHRIPPTAGHTPPRISVTLRSIPLDIGRGGPRNSSRSPGR